jgi:hypothetical protein
VKSTDVRVVNMNYYDEPVPTGDTVTDVEVANPSKN